MMPNQSVMYILHNRCTAGTMPNNKVFKHQPMNTKYDSNNINRTQERSEKMVRR